MSSESTLESFFGVRDYAEKSVFQPENLIETAIKQKRLQREKVPDVCILDPDGDIVRYLVAYKVYVLPSFLMKLFLKVSCFSRLHYG